VPIERPEAVNVPVLLQVTLASVPQVPDNNCMCGLAKFVLPLMVIVGFVACAVKIYHTSYVGVPQAVAGTPADNVAPITFPIVFTQVPSVVNVTAPAQLSLAGAGSVIQILKVPVADGSALVEYTLIKYGVPIDSPEAVSVDVLLHEKLASEPQLPDNTWMCGFANPTPRLLKVIVGFVVCAVKLYHTSYVGVPQPVGAGIPEDSVEAITVPAVLTQVSPEVKETAPAQSSLAGAGSVIHILKVPLVVGAAPFKEYTRT